MRKRSLVGFSGLLLTGVITGCGTTQASGGSTQQIVLTVGTVNNSQMVQMEQLTKSVFEKQHPNIKVEFVTLPETQLRQKVTQDVATNAGKFDVVTIGNYETPIWAANQWISNLQPRFAKMSSKAKSAYDYADLIKPIMQSLSYHGSTYSLPFYGESSMIMYNKTLFKAHHLTMPLHPTWQQIASFAKAINDPSKHIYGILLRGQSGWGMNLAPLDTVINTFGGRWFNMKWQPRLTGSNTEKAVSFYVNLLQKYGEPSPASTGWQGSLSLMSQGKAGMYYDATSEAGVLETPSASKIAGQVGFAYAPTDVTNNGSHWLWSWTLAMVKNSRHKSAAFQWMTWATSPQYLVLAGKTFGWQNVPPGTRYSIYHNPQYLKAAPFAKITLNSINTATPNTPTLKPVPYTGIQFIEIPQFESVGQEVSQDISAAIAGQTSVKSALKQADSQLKSQVNASNVAGFARS